MLIDDDVIDFTTCQMGNVVLSMDGRQEVHDKMRHTKVGGGTYDMIMDNFKRIVGEREKKRIEASHILRDQIVIKKM